jgi:hypothetical protein
MALAARIIVFHVMINWDITFVMEPEGKYVIKTGMETIVRCGVRQKIVHQMDIILV